jgi:hypothetical protein
VLTLADLSRATLARQMLLAREKLDVPTAVERLAGMQAQLARAPSVGLFSRVTKIAPGDLERAFDAKKIVRATLMRGTLHLVSARDFLAFRGPVQRALDAGLAAILKGRMKDVEAPAVTKSARAFFATPQTFDAFRKHLEEEGGDVRAKAYFVRCTVPLVQLDAARFVLAEKHLGEKPKSQTDARELVRRYLAAFGPATVADAQTWSGIPDLKETFAAIRDELVVLQDEKKRELFDLAKAPRDGDRAPARFLPEFDNLVLSHKDRRRFVADAHRKSIYLPGLRVAPTFLAEGVIAGTWKIERKKAVATLTVTPFDKLQKADQKTLSDEGEALARFVEPDATSHVIRWAR